MNQVAVIIPFYKSELTDTEKIALYRCFKVLGNYTIIAIKPKSLDLSHISMTFNFSQVKSYDDQFFCDINGYNKLMLSSLFYESLLTFEYILIYQLDAFVFSDKLKYWCDQQYDYIGAPWLYSERNFLSGAMKTIKAAIYRKFNKQTYGMPNKTQFYNQVGNGGFSLRKVHKFYELSIKFSVKANDYLTQKKGEFNEDIFWSIEVNRKTKHLHIPNYRKAMKFAIETEPESAFRLNKGELPFGCHAWDKNILFWKTILQQEGVVIGKQ